MKTLSIIVCLSLGLLLSQSSFGGEPTHRKGEKENGAATTSKTMAWTPGPAAESISCYNVYEKVGHGEKSTSWKRIGTVCTPSFTVEKMSRGQHTFGITAVSPFGESARSELVVSR